MKRRLIKAVLMLGMTIIPSLGFCQTYYGDTLWTRDYSSTGAFSCAFSPDGSKLAVAYECMGPMIRVIDVNNGQILWETPTPDLCLYNIQFSSNGQYIAIAEELGHLLVVDYTIPDTIYNIDTQTGGVNAVDFSPAGDYIYAGCNDGTIRIYATATGAHQYTIPAHTDRVLSVDVSSTGHYLASGSKDNTAKVWDLWDGYQLIYQLTEHSDDIKAVKFTPDQNRLLTGSVDDMIHSYWMPDGTLDTMLNLHAGDVNTIDISSDGSFAMTGSNDQSVEMINLHNYANVATFTNLLQTRVYGVAISPQMDKMAAANHIGYVIMYNIQSLISVEGETEISYIVYPNPAMDKIYINGLNTQAAYRLINLNGQTVQTGNTSGSIDIVQVPAGIYFLQIGNGFVKIIKQ